MACLDHGDARRQGQPFMMLEFPRHRGVRAAFFQEGEQKISTRAAADRDTFDRAGPRPQPIRSRRRTAHVPHHTAA